MVNLKKLLCARLLILNCGWGSSGQDWSGVTTIQDMPGIKADFVLPLEPRHICGICKLVVRSPMQTDCGHIFCNDCLNQAMSNGEIILCPIDSEKISQVEIHV